MNKKEVINFSEFFGDKPQSKLSKFNKDDFKDLFIEESKEETQVINKLPDEVEDIVDEIKSEFEPTEEFNPPVKAEDFYVEDEEVEELEFEDSIPSTTNKNNYNKIKESKNDYYPLFRDKTENFSCDVLVEGAKISDTQARLILESDEWTLMFEGEIDKSGKCNIPIRKLNIFDEGMIGKIRLEVIAENTVFIPWEDEFEVRMSKKVSVQVNEGNRRYTDRNSNVKVRLR